MINQLFLEKLLMKETYNLTNWENFGNKLPHLKIKKPSVHIIKNNCYDKLKAFLFWCGEMEYKNSPKQGEKTLSWSY